MFGVIGAVGVAAGNETANRKRAGWMKRCEIEDPVEQIRETVAEALAKTLSLEVLEADRRTKSTTIEGVIKDPSGRRPGPGHPHDQVGHPPDRGGEPARTGSLRLRIRRLSPADRCPESVVVADGTCSIQFSNGDNPPTIRELLEDDCALLDKGLALSATTCAKRFLTKALGLPPAEP